MLLGQALAQQPPQGPQLPLNAATPPQPAGVAAAQQAFLGNPQAQGLPKGPSGGLFSNGKQNMNMLLGGLSGALDGGGWSGALEGILPALLGHLFSKHNPSQLGVPAAGVPKQGPGDI